MENGKRSSGEQWPQWYIEWPAETISIDPDNPSPDETIDTGVYRFAYAGSIVRLPEKPT